MKINPLGERILVKRVDEEEKSKGGIIIPDTAKEKPQEGKDAFGFDAAAEVYCDVLKTGIIDPTKVVRCALQNAAGVQAPRQGPCPGVAGKRRARPH